MLTITLSDSALPEISLEDDLSAEAYAAILFYLHGGHIEDMVYNYLAAKLDKDAIDKILSISSQLIQFEEKRMAIDQELFMLNAAKIPIIGNQDVDTIM